MYGKEKYTKAGISNRNGSDYDNIITTWMWRRFI